MYSIIRGKKERMGMKPKNLLEIFKQTFKEWNEDKAPRLAAALSYYTVFSLAPLLVLVIAITSFIIGNNVDIRNEIMRHLQGLVGPQGAEIVSTLIERNSQPGSGILATIIGIVTLLLGATGVFGQLQDALNTIWEVKPKAGRGILGMLKDRFLSFTMVLGTSFLLLVSLVISTALAFLNQFFTDWLGGLGVLAQMINIIVSIGVVTVIFAMIFKFLPDVKIRWADVWIGSLFTAVLFTIGRILLSIYLGNSATTSAYGAAGSLVVLLLWVYYSSQILFFGAEFTQVYARMYGSRILPTPNARALTETERAHQGMPRQIKPEQTVQTLMMPVIAQPDIHPKQETIRYEPPNPAVVVPVVAAGALASLYTLGRIIRKLAA